MKPMLKFLLPQTICTNCKHHIFTASNTADHSIWYNHICGASPLPKTIDPVTGKEGYVTTNSLGENIIGNRKFEYCRDINNGNCHLYEPE